MKQNKTFTRVLAIQWCIVMLGIMLLLSACGGSSSPSTQPSSTPTSGGYNLIQLVNHEIHAFVKPSGQ